MSSARRNPGAGSVKAPVESSPTQWYMGIDPGASGGIAVLNGSGEVLAAVPMPATDRDILDSLSVEAEMGGSVVAVIESVNPGFPGTSKSNMSKLYGSFRALQMALTAAGISYDVVAASKWQRALGIPPRKKSWSRTQWKGLLKAAAQQKFPGTKVTLATADALLQALYCRRLHTGTLVPPQGISFG
jgi:hypothetical protein